MTHTGPLPPPPTAPDAEVLRDMFAWLRTAGPGEDHVPSRILYGCVAAERGVTSARASELVDEQLVALGHDRTPVLVSGRDAATVLGKLTPHPA